jgi:hypothetical protein
MPVPPLAASEYDLTDSSAEPDAKSHVHVAPVIVFALS